jgi:tetratricopeptide (TPR) repeat protein
MRAAPLLLTPASVIGVLCLAAEGPSRLEREALSRGSALEERGEYERAKAVYLGALEQVPRSGEIRLRVGLIDLRESRWPEAIASLEEAARSRPKHVDTVYYLAQAYYLDGRHGDAREALARAIALAPERPDVSQKYGEYLCEDKLLEEGLRHLLKAQRLDPDLQDIDFDLGMAYHKLAEIPEAQRHLEAALKRDPGNLVAARFLADTLGREGQWDKAKDLYQSVVAHDPRNAWALYGLGQSLLALGEAEAALAPLRGSVAEDPTIAEAHFQLGRALRKLGRRDEEERELALFTALRSRKPASSPSVNAERTPAEARMWDECRRLLDANKEGEALAYLDSLPKVNAPSSHYLVGVLYLTLGRSADAVRVLTRAVALSPDDPDVLAFLGRAYVADGRPDEAETTLARARELKADGELPLIGAGELELARGRWEQAIRFLEESRTTQVPTLLKLLRCYVLTGNQAKALETAELVRAFGKSDPAALRELDSILSPDAGPGPRP